MSLFGDVNPPFEDERESTFTSTLFSPEETDDDCWGQVPMKASLSSLEGTKPSAFSLGGFGPGFQCESPPDTFLDFGASTLSSNNAPPAEPQSETKVKTSGSSKGEKKLKGKKGKKAQAAVEFTPGIYIYRAGSTKEFGAEPNLFLLSPESETISSVGYCQEVAPRKRYGEPGHPW